MRPVQDLGAMVRRRCRPIGLGRAGRCDGIDSLLGACIGDFGEGELGGRVDDRHAPPRCRGHPRTTDEEIGRYLSYSWIGAVGDAIVNGHNGFLLRGGRRSFGHIHGVKDGFEGLADLEDLVLGRHERWADVKCVVVNRPQQHAAVRTGLGDDVGVDP